MAKYTYLPTYLHIDYGQDRFCFQEPYPVKKMLSQPQNKLKYFKNYICSVLKHQILLHNHQINILNDNNDANVKRMQLLRMGQNLLSKLSFKKCCKKLKSVYPPKKNTMVFKITIET